MPRKKVADSPSIEGPSRKQVDFSKAQGSSRNDESDLRDVARQAAKKSQDRQADEGRRKKISNDYGRHSDGHASAAFIFPAMPLAGPA